MRRNSHVVSFRHRCDFTGFQDSPQRATSGWIISTVPCLKRFLNCQRVYKRSPVANGTATESATSLNVLHFQVKRLLPKHWMEWLQSFASILPSVYGPVHENQHQYPLHHQNVRE